MMTALFIVLGVSTVATLFLLAGVMLAARRPMPAYQATAETFSHQSYRSRPEHSDALLAA